MPSRVTVSVETTRPPLRIHPPAAGARRPAGRQTQNGRSSSFWASRSGPAPPPLGPKSSAGTVAAPPEAVRALAGAAEHEADVLRHDLGRVALLALLVLPLAGADACPRCRPAGPWSGTAPQISASFPHSDHPVPLGVSLLPAALSASARWSRGGGWPRAARPACSGPRGCAPRCPTRITLLTPLICVLVSGSPPARRGLP